MSKFLKKLMYVIVALALFGALISFVISQVPPLPMLVNGFFTSIEKESYDTAYFVMSSEFKKTHTVDDFKEILEESDLITAKEWESQSHSINKEESKGLITGFVTITEDAKSRRVPIEIQFVLEDNSLVDRGWRITTIKRKQ